MRRAAPGAWRRALYLVVIPLGLHPAGAAEPPDLQLRMETDRLVIEWREGETREAIEAARAEGERFHAAISKLLGHGPGKKITILLMGPAEQPDGSREYPRIDSGGRILLYRFTPEAHGYLSALAHEMVHVFRHDRRAGADWFFEEGFAEFVAREVDPSMRGFPWYGYPIAVAAGQWVAGGEDIPLTTLRERHRALNQPWKAQSYSGGTRC